MQGGISECIYVILHISEYIHIGYTTYRNAYIGMSYVGISDIGMHMSECHMSGYRNAYVGISECIYVILHIGMHICYTLHTSYE